MISCDEARRYFSYDPETGVIVWKIGRGNKIKAGAIAGRVGPRKSVSISFDGKYYLGHRIAWLIHYGDWPKGVLDHIDGNPTNNRINNLRDVSQSENRRNSKLSIRSKYGFSGVTWRARDRRWLAQISVGGKSKHIGHYTDFFQAVWARKQAELDYGYHANHGRAK